MQKQALLGMVIVSSVLVAQGETKFGRPQDPATKTAALRPEEVSRLLPRDRILFDQVDGSLWAAADRYKVGFSRRGASFVPSLGSEAVHDWPATFRLEGARIADTRLELADKDPQRVATTVRYDRGTLVENYDLSPEGMEQSFRFDSLPARGEMVLSLGVSTELEMRTDGAGIDFRGPDGGFRYGKAVAIDAKGDSVPVEERLSGSVIELVVPASFVEKAALPLVIDPMIGSMFVAHGDTKQIDSVDMGWSPIDGTCTICYERHYSQTDSDVYLLALNSSLTTVLSYAIVDASTTSWRNCRVASITASQCHLVVAEVSTANVSPFTIMARRAVMTNGNLVLDAALQIAGPGVPANHAGDCLSPDVGGDPSNGTGSFTIVWERQYSVVDHDIEMRRVDGTGALMTSTSTTLDNSTSYESGPVISKWNGTVPGLPQKWAVVYLRRSLATGIGYLRASIIGKDGIPANFGPDTSIQITGTTPVTFGGYDVSSASDDTTGRRFLVAHTVLGANNVRTIFGVVFDSTGAIQVGDQEILYNESLPLEDVRNPAVDCDGCRFAVEYTRVFNSATHDEDLLVKTFGVVGNSLIAQESEAVAISSDFEGSPAIIARKGNGAGNATVDYAMAWNHEIDPSNWNLETQRYEGRGVGGFAIRAAGCSGVVLSYGGSPQLGRHVTFHVSSPNGILGLLAGLPMSIAFPDCSCLLAVNGQAYTGTDFDFLVPCNAALVGGTVSFQAFGVAAGSCLGSIGLTDAVDVTMQ
ncbi:MAG: hypothetical protein U1F36_10825 [Planctomycetota bacterium]